MATWVGAAVSHARRDTASSLFGAAVTHTRRSATLFTVLPLTVDASAAVALFAPLADFTGSRRVDRETTTLLFLDFSSEAAATSALRAQQGKLAGKGFSGLRLDFDRDDRAKRNIAYERAKQKEEALFCVVCHAPALWLAPLSRLEALPRRTTDGAAAVDEEALLRGCAAAEGAPVLIQRPGRGVEKQVPLSCSKCGVRWGYRSAPLGQPSRCTYIHENGLTHSLRGGEAAAALREEAREALGGGGAKRGRPAAGGDGGGGGGGGGGGCDDAAGGGDGAAAAVPAGEAAERDAGGGGGGGAEEEEEDGEGRGAAPGAPAAPTAFSCAALAERYEKALKRFKGAPDG
jgi:hypothetical protein